MPSGSRLSVTASKSKAKSKASAQATQDALKDALTSPSARTLASENSGPSTQPGSVHRPVPQPQESAKCQEIADQVNDASVADDDDIPWFEDPHTPTPVTIPSFLGDKVALPEATRSSQDTSKSTTIDADKDLHQLSLEKSSQRVSDDHEHTKADNAREKAANIEPEPSATRHNDIPANEVESDARNAVKKELLDANSPLKTTPTAPEGDAPVDRPVSAPQSTQAKAPRSVDDKGRATKPAQKDSTKAKAKSRASTATTAATSKNQPTRKKRAPVQIMHPHVDEHNEIVAGTSTHTDRKTAMQSSFVGDVMGQALTNVYKVTQLPDGLQSDSNPKASEVECPSSATPSQDATPNDQPTIEAPKADVNDTATNRQLTLGLAIRGVTNDSTAPKSEDSPNEPLKPKVDNLASSTETTNTPFDPEVALTDEEADRSESDSDKALPRFEKLAHQPAKLPPQPEGKMHFEALDKPEFEAIHQEMKNAQATHEALGVAFSHAQTQSALKALVDETHRQLEAAGLATMGTLSSTDRYVRTELLTSEEAKALHLWEDRPLEALNPPTATDEVDADAKLPAKRYPVATLISKCYRRLEATHQAIKTTQSELKGIEDAKNARLGHGYATPEDVLNEERTRFDTLTLKLTTLENSLTQTQQTLTQALAEARQALEIDSHPPVKVRGLLALKVRWMAFQARFIDGFMMCLGVSLTTASVLYGLLMLHSAPTPTQFGYFDRDFVERQAAYHALVVKATPVTTAATIDTLNVRGNLWPTREDIEKAIERVSQNQHVALLDISGLTSPKQSELNAKGLKNYTSAILAQLNLTEEPHDKALNAIDKAWFKAISPTATPRITQRVAP